MLRHLFVIISCFLALAVNAQSAKFLDNLRKNEAGKAKVTVTQSAAIDALVNGKGYQNKVTHASNNPQSNAATAQKQPQQHSVKEQQQAPKEQQHPLKEENSKPEASANGSQNTLSHGDSDAPEETPIIDTRKKVMRNSYKMTGYRIQVFSGGNSRVDKQKAEKAGLDMKRYFPSEPVYVHFYSPSWKCRMGNYKTTEEAHRILTQVKKHYPQACIVKGTINVQY